MNKSLAALLIFLISAFGALGQQERTSLVFNVGLVSGQGGQKLHAPNKLDLGAEILKEANYKLFHNDEVIGAGLLRAGFNVIPLEARHWFERSEELSFMLELKSGSQLEQIPFTIQVELDSEDPQSDSKAQEGVLQPKEYSLELFLDEELLAARKKSTALDMSMAFDTPIMPRNYDPNDPDSHMDPLANSFSIFDVVGLAYYLAREAFFKGEGKKPVLALGIQKQMTISYKRFAAGGKEREVSATVTFTNKDDEIL
jgi:hypothetical protein